MMRHRCAPFVLLGLAAVAVLILFGSAETTVHSVGSRLLAIDPLPEFSGEMCQWMPVSATEQETQFARLQQPKETRVGSDDIRITLERPPLRVIKDPYPTYSAVAV